MIANVCRRIGLAVALLLCGPSFAQQTPLIQVPVQARPIASFEIGHSANRFGSLEFVGGLDLSSPSAEFGSLSGFRFRSPGSDFIGVTDTGYWFFGKIDRGSRGEPVGFSNFAMQQFVDRAGKPLVDKRFADAEGLALKADIAAVGFERQHRVSQYAVVPGAMGAPLRDLNFLVPKHELRQNRGFEALAYAPDKSALQGALVIVSEKSLDKKGNVFAAVLDGPKAGVFSVMKNDRFDITDSAFLPNGDLLLLERAFSMSTGVGMRLRRIPGNLIAGGADAIDGSVLIEASMTFQIDNMEAMDVWQQADGATMISLVSDDNGSMLQRTIYLEFRLVE